MGAPPRISKRLKIISIVAASVYVEDDSKGEGCGDKGGEKEDKEDIAAALVVVAKDEEGEA
jgi:hypothetical protein